MRHLSISRKESTTMTLYLLGLVLCFSGMAANPGTKFVLAFPQNEDGRRNRKAELIMTPAEENYSPVKVKIWNTDYTTTDRYERTVILNKDTSGKVFIPMAMKMPVGNSVQSNLTTIIEASDQINVYVRNIALSNTESFLVLPLSDLKKDYFVLTYKPQGEEPASSFALIVSTGNTNHVTVTLPSSLEPEESIWFEGVEYGKDDMLTVTLEEYDAFQLQAMFDLTGTRIISAVPVGVIVGLNRTQVFGYCRSHVTEMIPPVEFYGDTYVLVPAINTTQVFKILASQSDTSVRVYFPDGSSEVYQLQNAGSFIEIPSENNQCFYAVSTKPIAVARFFTNLYTDSDGTMSMLAPLGKVHLSQYRIGVPDWFKGNPFYITYVIDKGSEKGLILKLNGESQGHEWRSSGTYEVASRPDLSFGAILINVSDQLTLVDLRHPDGVEFMAYQDAFYTCEAEGIPLSYGNDKDYRYCYTISTDGEDFILGGLQEEKVRDFQERLPPTGQHCCIKEDTERQCEVKSSSHHCELTQEKVLSNSSQTINTTSPISCYSHCLTVTGCFGVNFLDKNDVIKTCELLLGTFIESVQSSTWRFFTCSTQLFFKTVE